MVLFTPAKSLSIFSMNFFTVFTLLIFTCADGVAQSSDSKDTVLFDLHPDATKNMLVDSKERVVVMTKDAVIESDARFGVCVRLGESGIAVKDEGGLNFEDGMTLEAWVRFDEIVPEKASLAVKVGSFAFDLQKGKLNTAWMVFPTEGVATTAPQQFKYYPVGGDTINGLMNVPVGRWTRLTASYDEALGVVTTLIDGLVDRRRFRYRGAERLQSDGKSPLTLLAGCKGMRVASIKLTRGTPDVLPPTMEAYLNALPYRGQMMLTLDHMDPRLPLPIEIAIIMEKASGVASTLQTLKLDSPARRDVVLEAPTWLNSLHTMTVSATAGGRQFFSKNLRLANVKPAGRVMLHEDHTISREGKKFFPLMIYHAMPEHFPQMKELGFNLVLNDFNLNRAHSGVREGYVKELTQCLDAAQQSDISMIVSANAAFGKLFTIPVAKDHPALALWYGDDEPWGDLTRLHESYNTIKLLAPDPPVLIVQNNYSRLQDTAPGCDILATDPYPVPNVSLRAVVDATRSARRAVADQKPVWTVLPQYGAKIPTRNELRCMVWLALASGANGLGIFAWDERLRDAKTGEIKGWFTPEHPEQIEDLRAVLAEVRAFENVLLATQSPAQPTFVQPNPAVHVLLKEADGKRWLIAANDSRKAEEVTFKLDGPSSAKRLNPWTESSASLLFENDMARLRLDPLGVTVIEWP